MSPPRNGKRRRALLLACAVVIAAVLGLVAALSGGHSKTTTTGKVRSSADDPVLVSGTPAAFRYLSGQRSNRCGLTPAELEASPPTGHLQGSCCFPMDLSTYEWQVQALHRDTAIRQIPSDPYDVPASFARRLLRYDHAIHLSARQQTTYDRAMNMSREKGPCCCHCWRWSAFRGMSKYLIARTHYTAVQLALVIDDVEGCGGKDTPPNLRSQNTT